jgi:hypothetical protein
VNRALKQGKPDHECFNLKQSWSRENDLVAHHHLATRGAIILAAAAEAGCDLLLSEDMQDGLAWGGHAPPTRHGVQLIVAPRLPPHYRFLFHLH